MSANCGRHGWVASEPDEACEACIDETLNGHPELLLEEDHATPQRPWTEQIVTDVFHVLHPECPAYPGQPNNCDVLICDCGASDNSGMPLAEQVRALVDALADIFRDMGPGGYLPHIGKPRSDKARAVLGMFR